MKVRTRLFRAIATIGVLASMSAPGITAADAPSENEPAECSSRNSERATVAQIAANASAYQGRCVAVDATMRGRSLFDSVDGVYLQPTDSLNPSSSGLRIGLDNISRRNVEGYRSVSILGRVQDCETIRNCVYASLAENEVVMISGYCHSHNGAYLWVHDLRFRRGQAFERRMGSYARSDYGDLVDSPLAVASLAMTGRSARRSPRWRASSCKHSVPVIETSSPTSISAMWDWNGRTMKPNCCNSC